MLLKNICDSQFRGCCQLFHLTLPCCCYTCKHKICHTSHCNYNFQNKTKMFVIFFKTPFELSNNSCVFGVETRRCGESRGVGGCAGQKLLWSFSPRYPRLHLLSINPDTKGKKSSSADSKEEVEDVSVVHKHTQSEGRDRRHRVLALWHNSTSFSHF